MADVAVLDALLHRAPMATLTRVDDDRLGQGF